MKLQDQVAIVTGAGTGIGKAIALRFAREGAIVVAAAEAPGPIEEVAADIRSAGGRAVAMLTDVTVEEQVADMARRTSAELGKIDILVANSGISGNACPVVEEDLKDWSQVIAVNLTGAFLSCREVLKFMIPRRRGRIIMTSSGAGKRAYPLKSWYAASKWGLHGFMFSLAAEVGQYGITVNAICPGAVAGPRHERVTRALAESSGRGYEEVARERQSGNYLRRLTQPEDVASMALFLASDESIGITAQAISVDGGSSGHLLR